MRIDKGANEALIARARKIRHKVFVLEQNVHPDEEWDDKDETAIHFVTCDEGGNDLATGRLMMIGTTAKLQRIAVLKEARGRALGLKLMQVMLDHARLEKMTQAKLSAQCHAIPFYEKLGFRAGGDVYDDAGIPHRDMTLIL